MLHYYFALLNQINVKDQHFAKFIEDRILYRDMLAFVFSNKDDMEIFHQEVIFELIKPAYFMVTV